MALGAGPAHAIYFAVYEKVKAAGEKNLTFVPDMAVHAGAGAAAHPRGQGGRWHWLCGP